MAKEENTVVLEALNNEGKRTGQTNEFPEKVAENLLKLPNSKWVKPTGTAKEAKEAKQLEAPKQ